jgi:hypothetical protein
MGEFLNKTSVPNNWTSTPLLATCEPCQLEPFGIKLLSV